MATGIILPPVHVICTTSLTDLVDASSANTAPGVGKVRNWWLRAANVGAVDATVDLVLTNGTITITRLKNFPVPYNTPASAPDLEVGFLVPSGYKWQAKASAGSVVEVSGYGVEDDA